MTSYMQFDWDRVEGVSKPYRRPGRQFYGAEESVKSSFEMWWGGEYNVFGYFY